DREQSGLNTRPPRALRRLRYDASSQRGGPVLSPADLPTDLQSCQARFGTDEQCRDYLFEARWPDGFRCAGCGRADAYRHKKRLIDECVACGKQHSLLAGTIFEQTKTGLARWFLAVYLVTSSTPAI